MIDGDCVICGRNLNRRVFWRGFDHQLHDFRQFVIFIRVSELFNDHFLSEDMAWLEVWVPHYFWTNIGNHNLRLPNRCGVYNAIYMYKGAAKITVNNQRYCKLTLIFWCQFNGITLCTSISIIGSRGAHGGLTGPRRSRVKILHVSVHVLVPGSRTQSCGYFTRRVHVLVRHQAHAWRFLHDSLTWNSRGKKAHGPTRANVIFTQFSRDLPGVSRVVHAWFTRVSRVVVPRVCPDPFVEYCTCKG